MIEISMSAGKVDKWREKVDGVGSAGGLPEIGSPQKLKFSKTVGSPKSSNKKANKRKSSKRPGTTGGVLPDPVQSRVAEMFHATIVNAANTGDTSASMPDYRLKRNTKDGSYGFNIKSRNRVGCRDNMSARFGDDDMSSIGDWSVAEQNTFFETDHDLNSVPFPQSPIAHSPVVQSPMDGMSRAASQSCMHSGAHPSIHSRSGIAGGGSRCQGDCQSFANSGMTSRGNHTARSTVSSLFDSGSMVPPGGRPHAVTMMELLTDIRAKVDTGEDCPQYVRAMDDLPSEKLSWNGRPRELVIPAPVFHPFKLSDSHAATQMNATFKIPRSWSPVGMRPASTETSDQLDGIVPSGSPGVDRCNTNTNTNICTADYTFESDEEDVLVQPVVDIIGCNQPVELILAKADKKLRRIHDRRIMADQRKETEKMNLLAEINFRSTRHERHEEYLVFQRMQQQWLKTILTFNYIQALIAASRRIYEKNLDIVKMITAKKTIKQRLIIIIRRIRQRNVHRFMTNMGKAAWIFRLCVRIRRKRQAVSKCILFLNIYKDQRLVSFMVKQYFTKVHRCQKVARDMIGCTRARMIALERLWLQVEGRYLKYMLYKQAHSDVTKKVAERAAQKRLEKKQKEDALMPKDMPASPHKNRLGKKSVDVYAILKSVSKQGEIFKRIDGRIENTLNRLRVSGSEHKRKTTEETIEELGVPWHDRHVILRELLSRKRAEYKLLRASMDLTKPKNGSIGKYSDEDALLMLKGGSKTVNQLLLRELHVEFDPNSTPPFYLFKYVTREFILEMIHTEHEQRNTFIISLDIETIKHAILSPPAPPYVYVPPVAASSVVAPVTMSVGMDNNNDDSPRDNNNKSNSYVSGSGSFGMS